MWIEELKKANVSIHAIATGAGAGLQHWLWQTPGSSAYLSGASFPYNQSETEDILGFCPEHFVSKETAIDLASAAYMKAFRFAEKKPVGIGITASVASEQIHRGDHRYDICVMTDDKVLTRHVVLEKGVGFDARIKDGKIVDMDAFMLMFEAVGIGMAPLKGEDASELAKERFFLRPFFSASGKRYATIPNHKSFGLMSGAFNPPHEGHFGIADNFTSAFGKQVVFEVSATPPHKAALTVQELLKRSKMLQGRDRLFSTNIPFYIDKARAFPGSPLILGADALLRMLDPKWGIDVHKMMDEFQDLGNRLYTAPRMVDNKLIGWPEINEAMDRLSELDEDFSIQEIPGRWDISSTELRNKIK
jgi:hypothetical protein